MILIKYLPEEINLQDQPETLEGQNINDIYNPTFEIEDLAYNQEYSFGKLFGSLIDFQSLNTENVNYWIINELPVTGVQFYSDPKFGIPKSPNDVLKLKIRTRIEQEVGDDQDLLSDLSKRVTMLERLVIRMANDLINNSPTAVPTIDLMYKDMVQGYLALLAAYDNQANIADLEDASTLFQKLFDRSVAITEIVKEDYIDKMD